MFPKLRSKPVLFALALSIYAGGLASSPSPSTAKDKPTDASAHSKIERVPTPADVPPAGQAPEQTLADHT
jgi:hypothetical protein